MLVVKLSEGRSNVLIIAPVAVLAGEQVRRITFLCSRNLRKQDHYGIPSWNIVSIFWEWKWEWE